MRQETLVHAFLNAKFDSMPLDAFVELLETETEFTRMKRKGIAASLEQTLDKLDFDERWCAAAHALWLKSIANALRAFHHH